MNIVITFEFNFFKVLAFFRHVFVASYLQTQQTKIVELWKFY